MPFDAEINPKSQTLIALERARARIVKGWCQGELQDAKGNVCILGAFYVDDPYEALNWNFATQGNIAAWNDDPDRTKAEVLQVFDAAIERLSTELVR